MNQVLFAGLFLGCVLLGEVLYVLTKKNQLARKFSHISASLVAVGLTFVASFTEVAAAGLIMIGLLSFFWYKKWLPVFTSKKGLVGTLLFPVGLIVSGFFFWDQQPHIFRASALVLGFSDTASCWIGLAHPKPKWRWWPKKSLAGSTAFLISTLLVLFLMLGQMNVQSLLILTLIAVAITTVESVFGEGTDNLVIPVTTAVLLDLVAIG